MDTPKKVSIRDEPEGPVFVYHWWDWGFIIVFIIGLAFGLFPLFFVVNIDSNMPLAVWLFLLLFSAIGLGIAYWSLGHVINRSEIRLHHSQFSVRHKPLPWRYNASLPTGDIQAVRRETY
jgi:hypothetical protein